MAVNGHAPSDGNRDSSTKRSDCLDWDEYFMSLAFLTAKRSKDPATQVGACIVNQDNCIVSLGYNGMPRGCSDDEFPWGKKADSKLDTKHYYVVHAEMNAILNTNSQLVNGCTMYVALFPCNECAKAIIQTGIKTVVYLSDKHSHKDHTKAAKRMLDAASIKYRQYIPKNKRIVINFRSNDETDEDKTLSTSSAPSTSREDKCNIKDDNKD